MKEEEKIFAGKFFCPGHPDLKAIKLRCHNLCSAYNATLEDETEKRNAIVHQIFGDFGEGRSRSTMARTRTSARAFSATST